MAGQISGFERDVLRLVNQHRKKRGLNQLVFDRNLNEAADVHARNMGNKDFFSHTGKDGSDSRTRATRAGYETTYVGENIAAGQRTAKEVVKDWMKSPGHRANILNPNYNELGVGYFKKTPDTGNVNYTHYWVQVFGRGDVDIVGTGRNDRLVGTNGAESLFGRNGNDVLIGKNGADRLVGGNGHDQLVGGGDADTLVGGDGRDVLIGGKGNDVLSGQEGKDFFHLFKNQGTDIIKDFSGQDKLMLGSGMKFRDLTFSGNSIFHSNEKLASLTGVDTQTLTRQNFDYL